MRTSIRTLGLALALSACGGSAQTSSWNDTLAALRAESEFVEPLPEVRPEGPFAAAVESIEPRDEATLGRLLASTSTEMEIEELLALLRDVSRLERGDCEGRVECVRVLARAYRVFAIRAWMTAVADLFERQGVGPARWRHATAEVFRQLPRHAVRRQSWAVARLLELGAPEEVLREAVRWAAEGVNANEMHEEAARLAQALTTREGVELEDRRRAAAFCYAALWSECGDAWAADFQRAGGSTDEIEALEGLRDAARTAIALEGRGEVPTVLERAEALERLRRSSHAREVIERARERAPEDARLRMRAIRLAELGVMREGAAQRYWATYYADIEEVTHASAEFLEMGAVVWWMRTVGALAPRGDTAGIVEAAPAAIAELDLLLERLEPLRPVRAFAIGVGARAPLLMAVDALRGDRARARVDQQLSQVLAALEQHPDEAMLYHVAYYLAIWAETRELAIRAVSLELPTELGDAREEIRERRERAQVALALRWGQPEIVSPPARDEDSRAYLRAMALMPEADPGAWAELVPRFQWQLAQSEPADRLRAANNLGVVLYRAGRPDEARSLLAEASGAGDAGPVELNVLATTPPDLRDADWSARLERLIRTTQMNSIRWQALVLLVESSGAGPERADEVREEAARLLADGFVLGDSGMIFRDGASFGIGFGTREGVTGTVSIDLLPWLLVAPASPSSLAAP